MAAENTFLRHGVDLSSHIGLVGAAFPLPLGEKNVYLNALMVERVSMGGVSVNLELQGRHAKRVRC